MNFGKMFFTFIKMFKKPNEDTRYIGTGWNDLMVSAFYGMNNVEKLLQQGIDVNQVDCNGCDALMLAAQNGHESIVDMLLQYGSEVNKTRIDGCDALMLAAQSGHEIIVAVLLDYKSDVNNIRLDGSDALMLAAQSGHEIIVADLLNYKSNVNKTRLDGSDALILAAQSGNERTVDILLKYGSDANKKRLDGFTALMLASRFGFDAVVELLVNTACDVTISNHDGWNALTLASLHGHDKTVDLLLGIECSENVAMQRQLNVYEYCFNTNAWENLALENEIEKLKVRLSQHAMGWDSLMRASFEGNTTVVIELLKNGADVKRVDNSGNNALSLASVNGHEEIVELLITNKANINQTNERGEDPLIVASSKGYFKVVNILLKNGANTKYSKTDGWNALMFAASNGHGEVVESLIAYGVDVNQTNNAGTDALIIASKSGHGPVSELLLKNGAKVSHVDNDGMTALILASSFGHEKVVEILIKHEADIKTMNNKGTDALMEASERGHLNVVKTLLENGADVNATNMDGFSALTVAAFNGHEELVESLIKYNADINHITTVGSELLMEASSNGNMNVVKILIKHGVDAESVDKNGRTALILASSFGHEKVVEILIKHEADVKKMNNKGTDALMEASARGHLNVVKTLLENGANARNVNMGGVSALMAAVLNGHMDVVDLLIKFNADIHHTNYKGRNSLMEASLKGDVNMVIKLLENGANVKYTKKDGVSALIMASKMGHVEIVELLIKYNADVHHTDNNGIDSLMEASFKGNFNMVQILLRNKANVNYVNKDGVSALILASIMGHTEIVELLIKFKADVNQAVDMGRNSLMLACSKGHTKVVELLIKHGASVSSFDKNGENALMFASKSGHVEVVILLLSINSDITATNVDGLDSLQMASMFGQVKVVELILQHNSDNHDLIHNTDEAALQAVCNGHYSTLKLILEKRNANTCIGTYDKEIMFILELGFRAVENGHLSLVKILHTYFTTIFSFSMPCIKVQLANEIYECMKQLEHTDKGAECITASERKKIDVASSSATRFTDCCIEVLSKKNRKQTPTVDELLSLSSNMIDALNRINPSKIHLFTYHKCLFYIFEIFEAIHKDNTYDFICLLLDQTFVDTTMQHIEEHNVFNIRSQDFSPFFASDLLNIFVVGGLFSGDFAMKLARCGICSIIAAIYSLCKDFQDKKTINILTVSLDAIAMTIAFNRGGLEYLNSSNVMNEMENSAQNKFRQTSAKSLQIINKLCVAELKDYFPSFCENARETLLNMVRKEFKKNWFHCELYQETEKLRKIPPSGEELDSIWDESVILSDFGVFDETFQSEVNEKDFLQPQTLMNAATDMFELLTENRTKQSNPWPWLWSRMLGRLPFNADEFTSPDFPEQFEITPYLLGKGGFGSVHLIKDMKHADEKKYVAKKIDEINMATLNIFKNEASILLKTRHKRIVRFYGFLKNDKECFIFLEYVKEGTLSSFIQQKRYLKEKRTRHFTIQILDGLLYLHERKILHRDIKGTNILMEDNQNIKITDFGISELFDERRVARGAGTIRYMAPEVMSTDGKISKYTIKSDIWSVGCTVVEMLTGNPPNHVLLPAQIAFRIRAKKPLIYEFPQSPSVELKEFLEKVLNWDTEKRPSAYDLLTTDPFVLIKLGEEVLYSNLDTCSTSEVDETYGTTTTFFQTFMDLLKQYWSKLLNITNQNLIIDYFHKDRYNITKWFELFKQSQVISYLQKINQDGQDIDLVLGKQSSHEQFKDALVFTSVVLSYSNNLLEVLKAPLQLEKTSTEIKQFYRDVETVSNAIYMFQALMPWFFSSCLEKIEAQMGILKSAIENMSCVFDEQQLAELELSKFLVVYDVDIMCSVLGLQTKFSQFAKQVSVDMWLSDLQQSQVVNWLGRNSSVESLPQAEGSIEAMSQANTLRQKLLLLGFTSWKAASIADNISEDWINHQSALGLATSHILDMFQCHPVLTVASGFPYTSTVTDALFDQTVEMNDGRTVSERSIKIINVSDINNKDVQSHFLQHIKNSVPNGNIKLFHGTSHEDAKSILTKGIRLGRGRQFQDFSHGDGFYLSYVYNHAKERAIHKSKKPAIIVYSITEVTFQQYAGLTFFDDINSWRTTVKYCRNGYEGLMPDNFPAYYYVAGPMCMNVEDVIESNQEPVTHVVEKKQLCVKKPELAGHFNLPDNIVCVIFYKETMH